MSANQEAIDMATVAAAAAASKLADDVLVIDVSGQLFITDCFVIASASNERQVNAIVDEVEEKMRQAGYKTARREGAREGAHPAPRRSQLLCAGPAVERLPGGAGGPGGHS
jgi:ribosome-associated protein